ncbi:hypothetical protein HMPREF2854_02330 [Actinomyces sp. HMSC075B09]|nr:hypothetical protein HMPREF2854_02330 [Actinomyces sp. HMSC075B09]
MMLIRGLVRQSFLHNGYPGLVWVRAAGVFPTGVTPSRGLSDEASREDRKVSQDLSLIREED